MYETMKVSRSLALVVALVVLALPACQQHEAHANQEHHKIVATSPLVKDIVATQQYVCQIRSQRNIEVRALQEGYLEPITLREGQTVKAGDVLFKVIPTLYKTRLDAELAEVQLAQLELNNTKRLYDQKVVSVQDVYLFEAKLAKAQAKAAQAEAELRFTEVKAPYDGIIDRLYQQQGSLIKKEDLLTTLSDNSLMWVYFNVPEARYLDYMSGQNKDSQDQQLELMLANGCKFKHAGRIAAIEAKFNNETGNIPFRADFPNPDRLLRHGQTGTVLIHRTQHDAVVIPQRATFEILDKRYAWVIGEGGEVRQRLITIQHELEDVFVIESGLDAKDKIVLEGVRQVRDGEKVEFQFKKPEEVLAHQKFHAE